MHQGYKRVIAVYANNPIKLNAGIELQINETQTAKIYGFDACKRSTTSGCTLITGKEAVDVVLVIDNDHDESFREKWSVEKNDMGYKLTRPNGWVVRKPSNNS